MQMFFNFLILDEIIWHDWMALQIYKDNSLRKK